MGKAFPGIIEVGKCLEYIPPAIVIPSYLNTIVKFIKELKNSLESNTFSRFTSWM